MRNGEWSKLVKVAGRILLAFVFVSSQSAWAGQEPTAKDAPKPGQKAAAQQAAEKTSSAVTPAKKESEETSEKTSEDGKHEGIKVHGHWTIEVRNPNGSIATHREFENSLAGAGAFPLTSFLSRTNSVGLWQIQLASQVGNTVGGPCSGGGTCTLYESGSGVPADGNNFNTLLVSATGNGSTFTLNGTAAASVGGNITDVFTAVETCPPSFSVASPCAQGPSISYTYNFLTSRTLSAPIPVGAGQTIAVTVVISFS